MFDYFYITDKIQITTDPTFTKPTWIMCLFVVFWSQGYFNICTFYVLAHVVQVKTKVSLLPCLEAVEPLALVRRWRTESGLWWRVER